MQTLLHSDTWTSIHEWPYMVNRNQADKINFQAVTDFLEIPLYLSFFSFFFSFGVCFPCFGSTKENRQHTLRSDIINLGVEHKTRESSRYVPETSEDTSLFNHKKNHRKNKLSFTNGFIIAQSYAETEHRQLHLNGRFGNIPGNRNVKVI